MIHAIIDIGSNTIRLAIYQLVQGHIDLLMKKKHLVGLASYIRNGEMSQKGIDRTVEVINEYREFLASFKISEITAFTTAALRNVKNSQEAVAEISRRTKTEIQVISGDDEAVYDFVGATHDLPDDDGLLIDIGGASTEIVFFRDREIVKKGSLPMGSLAFHTKYVEDILPNSDEIADMRKEAEEMLDNAHEFDGIREKHICGIGGTFKGTTALYNRIYDLEKRNHVIAAKKLPEIIDRYRREQGIKLENTINLMKAVPERIHTIIPGMIIADVIAKKFGSEEITYSNSGVREGYIYQKIMK